MMVYKDRKEAGRVLASKLRTYAGNENLLILGLPRGGIPVAYEVAKALNAPLDVFVIRKLGAPFQPELAMGAIAGGGIIVLNEEVVRGYGVTDEEINEAVTRETIELERREKLYRGENESQPIEGKIVILVDDGLATGASMRAAVKAAKKYNPEKVIVAVPVGARDTCQTLSKEADEIICAYMPEQFWAVGSWYEDFTQTEDREVRDLLEKSLLQKKHPD
jgi:putative phosphoribosyl transferase